ncbi:MAG: HAD hydrolase-like protein [Pirellulales bacterium]|nr:HAD hydrolase-like protein [Pirellulales bacterium]
MSVPFEKQREFFVGIDSDGCAFDTMELKHKECFIPNIIQHYGMQAISKYARETAEFVNLYSKSRGCNRFPGLVKTFQWLKKRPEVAARGWNADPPLGLVNWLGKETKLSNPQLTEAIASLPADANDVQHLRQALAWSEAVNTTIEEIVHGVPPYPLVRESLERLKPHADLVVVSATPNDALQREWADHDLNRFLRAIYGQESGSKEEILTAAQGYDQGHVLMIGDAPGDLAAAQTTGALFFPINPGREEESWQRFSEQGLDRFLQGTFTAAYQQELLDEFDQCLPSQPPWPVLAS